MRHLSIDIETYSSVDIKKSGLYKYVQSPDFQILLMAYSIDGGDVELVDFTAGDKIPFDVHKALLSPDVTKHAYNATFEWQCLSKHLQLPEPLAWLPQWRCTMLHGLYCGYTAGLGATAKALGLSHDKQKMTEGNALIRYFCSPCKPTKSNGMRARNLPHHEPERWELFKDYCRQDVIVEMAIADKLQSFPVPDDVQNDWIIDQTINSYGVAVDLSLVDNAIAIDEHSTNELMTEARELTGLDNPKSVAQLTAWLEEQTGRDIPNLQKATVSELVTELDGAPKRALEIRQELAKTSTSKYLAISNTVCDDGRVRGLLQFYGANRTGRWAGRLVQVQNLPRNYIGTLEIARELVHQGDTQGIRLLYGDVPDTLSQLIRTAFVPSKGNKFIVADFSAIEARVIAWLAGETWRQEVFATHGKIYEASASAMFGVPIDKIVRGNPEYELRQKGKVAELALGYQGGPGALKAMGALNMGLSEDELPDIVERWRQSNRRIVDLWYAIDRAAIACVSTAQPQGVNGIMFAREGDYAQGQDFLTITLPSGRKLYYPKPYMGTNRWGSDSVCFYGLDSSYKWGQVETYGGKLTENITQAIARDCLAESIRRLHKAGYKIVMHIHDEVVIDAPMGASLDDACDLMCQPISWADGLLLGADGFETDFYKKD